MYFILNIKIRESLARLRLHLIERSHCEIAEWIETLLGLLESPWRVFYTARAPLLHVRRPWRAGLIKSFVLQHEAAGIIV